VQAYCLRLLHFLRPCDANQPAIVCALTRAAHTVQEEQGQMKRTQEILQAELDFQVTRSSKAIIDAGNAPPRLAAWHWEQSQSSIDCYVSWHMLAVMWAM
jgi:hypothetical protein